MAGNTFDGFVLTLERILGVAGVIESDGFPILLFVARLAFCPEILLMLVILFMAANTSCRKLFFYFGLVLYSGLVAGITFGRDVFSQQGKFRIFIMIKFSGFPFFFVVASLAFHTQRALMHIILAMTGHTGGGCFCLEKRPLMASQAFHLYMFSQ